MSNTEIIETANEWRAKMKTIKFEGVEYEVEDWVKYVAKDSDGAVVAYEVRPFKNNSFFASRGRYAVLKTTDEDWQDSLIEV
jgi:hypothetical protein